MRKRKVLIMVAIVAVIAVVAIIVVIVVTNRQSPEDKALEVLNDILELPKTIVDNEETPPMILLVEERNGYELLSLEIDGDTAVGKFKVYSPDVYSVAKEVDSTKVFFEQDELLNAVIEKIKLAPIAEKEIDLLFIIVDGRYVPQLTSEFLDAYYGGVYRLREELLQRKTEGN